MLLKYLSLDISFLRPDVHQPWQSGPPTSYPQGNRAQLYRVPARPQHATRDTRENTLGSLLEGFGQPSPNTALAPGHDQGLFNPMHAVRNLNAGVTVPIPLNTRRGQHQQQIQNVQVVQPNAGPKAMLNGPNACFAAAGFVFVVGLEVL